MEKTQQTPTRGIHAQHNAQTKKISLSSFFSHDLEKGLKTRKEEAHSQRFQMWRKENRFRIVMYGNDPVSVLSG